MRILLVAPEFPDINSAPEIRTITELHTVAIYNGSVSLHDLYEVCRNNDYDVIHIASHAGKSGNSDAFHAWIELSNHEVLTPQDIVNLTSFAQAKLVFLNTCDSSIIASYITLHSVPACVYTNIDLKDKNAWIMPMSFYTTLSWMEKSGSVDMHRSFILSAPTSGIYGWSSSSHEYQEYLLEPIIRKIEEMSAHVLSSDENMRRLERSIEKVLHTAMVDRKNNSAIAVVFIAIIVLVSVIPDLILYRLN